MSKIIICGASSVGKTTLVDDWCSKNKQYRYIRNTAKDVLRRQKLTQNDLLRSLSSRGKADYFKYQRMVSEEQNKREAELGNRLFISDGGPEPLVHTFLVDEEKAINLSESKGLSECLARYRESLVVLVSPLEPRTDEEEEQNRFTDGLHRVLRFFGIPYMYLGEKDRELRLEILKKAVHGELPVDAEQFMDQLCLSFYLDRETARKATLPPPFLPMPKQGKEARVRTFDINPGEILLTYPPMDSFQTNRMVDRYGEENFVLIQFHQKLPNSCIREALKRGVSVNGERYHFLGCSSSGMKSRKCYLLRGSVENVEFVLSRCGNFSKIKMVSKRLKRISQLFSVAKDSGVAVPDEKVKLIEDIETSGGNFTDGCGFVGLKLAKQIAKGAIEQEIESPGDGVPSVFQIRFQGCKGIIIKDPNVGSDTIHVRKSMQKFQPGEEPFPNVWVCEHSRPNSYGHLNKQYIMLLSGLGIKDEVFLQKQRSFLTALENMLVNPGYAIKMLHWRNFPTIASMVAGCKSPEDMKRDEVQLPLRYVRNKLILKLEKLSLLIVYSRTLFGVCDPLSLMNYGECFVRISVNGLPKTLAKGTRVTVGKNPCYLLGDVRVLTAVDHPELNHLVDCIVFPVKGKSPHSAEIAGSDLDGDNYFVCWDKDLIPPHIAEPYDYPSVEAPPSDGVTRDMLIDYFSSQKNMMGKINNYFEYWADRDGPGCSKCEQLGAWFSRSVDSSKTGDVVRIPRYLMPPRPDPTNPPKDKPNKVWNRMVEIAVECKERLSHETAVEALSSERSVFAISEEFIQALLENKDRGASEYHLFRLVCKWCQVQSIPESEKVEKLRELSDSINFGVFTMSERREAIEMGVPAEKVMNALNKSKLLSREMLQPFYLHTPACGWKFYFRASCAEFDWKHLFRALKGFPESLLILQLPESLRLAFHFFGPFGEGESKISTGSLVSYFFSPEFDYKLRYVTESEYNLLLGETVIQFYRDDNPGNTFLWLGSQVPGRKNPDEIEYYDRVSIDLTRFRKTILRVNRHPLINKKPFYSAEVFVKSQIEDVDYFDIHESEQTEELVTIDLALSESLEELPSDDEEEKEIDFISATDTKPLLDPKSPLQHVKEFAKKGYCILFSKLMSVVKDKVLDPDTQSEISNEFLTLLSNLVVSGSHRKPSIPDTAESMETILQSPHINYPAPKDLLRLYSSLNKLHLNEVILQHIPKALDCLVLKTALQYFECIYHWEWWSFLPLSVSCQLSNKLYLLVRDILPQSEENGTPDPASLAMPDTIQDLARVCNAPTPVIERSELDSYKCYLAHLMLNHLLAESPGPEEYTAVTDTKDSVCMLRAANTNPEDTAVNEELESSSEDEDENKAEPSKDTVVVVEKKDKKKKKKKKVKYFKVCFTRINKIASSKFAAGSYVKIRLLTKPQSEHSSEPIALGCLSRVSRSPGAISVAIPEPVPSCIKRSAQLQVGFWCLTLVGNVTSFKRSSKALERLENSPDITSILISQDAFPPQVQREEMELEFNLESIDRESGPSTNGPLENPYKKRRHCNACTNRAHFNKSQEDAIYSALNQRLTLIHGPPGTGKTFVASEIIHQMCHIRGRDRDEEDRKSKILVAAETNNAVDNLTRKLVALNILVVRVGKLSLISKDIHEHTLDRQVEMKRVELGKDRKGEFQYPKLKKEILQSADVIATTCSGAGDMDLKDFTFPFILVDEATQAIEPVSLISIAKSCRQLVLIGDPKQLAPTLPKNQNSPENNSEIIPRFDALRVTLFHRLYRRLEPLFLEVQHRMHPYISFFPSCVFYSGKLKNGVTKDEREPPQLKFLHKDRPIVFIDVESQESRGRSKKNVSEAKVVVKIIEKLMATTTVSLDDIAILTPYDEQVRCIKDGLEFVAKVEVCSIDGFQGKEKDIIVFSTVRSNRNESLGFTDDQYRINVLLTRAKIALIGVGNSRTISTSKIWKEWLDWHKSILTEDEFYDLVENKETKRNEPNSRPTRGGRNQSEHERNGNSYKSRKPDGDGTQYYHTGKKQTLGNLVTVSNKKSQRERKYHRDSEV